MSEVKLNLFRLSEKYKGENGEKNGRSKQKG